MTLDTLFAGFWLSGLFIGIALTLAIAAAVIGWAVRRTKKGKRGIRT